MANLFFDDFNRPDEDLGASADWTERYGDYGVVSNQAELVSEVGSAQRAAYILSSYVTTADYSVTSNLDKGTATGFQYIGVCGRRVNYSTSDSDMYALLYSDTDDFVLYKRVSGSWTLIQRYTVTLTDNTSYKFELKMDGTTIEGYLDDVLRVSGTDSSLSASGDAGLQNGTDGSVNSGRSWNDFSVDDLTVGGVTGSGSHQAEAATSSGVAERSIVGSGSPQATVSQSSGTAERKITGAGSGQAIPALSSGTAERVVTGSGSSQAEAATSVGTVERVVVGLGAHQASTAISAGVGIGGGVSIGSGDHQSETATSSGIGERSIAGSGNNQAERATSTGIALRVITGSGSHQAEAATSSGSSLVLVDLEQVEVFPTIIVKKLEFSVDIVKLKTYPTIVVKTKEYEVAI